MHNIFPELTFTPQPPSMDSKKWTRNPSKSWRPVISLSLHFTVIMMMSTFWKFSPRMTSRESMFTLLSTLKRNRRKGKTKRKSNILFQPQPLMRNWNVSISWMPSGAYKTWRSILLFLNWWALANNLDFDFLEFFNHFPFKFVVDEIIYHLYFQLLRLYQ